MVSRRQLRIKGRPGPLEILRRLRRPGKRRRLDDGGVPVDPDKPSTLSGGAAAELEFDD